MTNGLVRPTVLDMYTCKPAKLELCLKLLSCVVQVDMDCRGHPFCELKEGRGAAAMAPLHLRSQCRWPEATAAALPRIIICLQTIQLLRESKWVCLTLQELAFAFSDPWPGGTSSMVKVSKLSAKKLSPSWKLLKGNKGQHRFQSIPPGVWFILKDPSAFLLPSVHSIFPSQYSADFKHQGQIQR